MQQNGSNSINFLFKCIGIGFVVLCVRGSIVRLPTLEVAQTIFFTFANNFILAIMYGLPFMFLRDVFLAIKRKIKKYYNGF